MCFAYDALPPDLPAELALGPIAGGAGAERLELTSADGTRFAAAFAQAPEPRAPAVAILPDVRGLYATRCPVLGLFGGGDESIPQQDVDAFERVLEAAGVAHEVVVYSGTPHSFFDRAYEQHAEACADAWRRTLGFLDGLAAPAS